MLILFLSGELKDTDLMAVLHDIDAEYNAVRSKRIHASLRRRIDPHRTKADDPFSTVSQGWRAHFPAIEEIVRLFKRMKK